MRQLLLLRHAKSSWDDPKLPDHARPLNARGREAAGAMGAALRNLALAPDVVLVSSARRTLQTLEALGPWDETPLIEPLDALYLADARQILQVLNGVAETARSVLLIGHNPGLHELAMLLAGSEAAGTDAPLRKLEAGYPTGALAEYTVPGPWCELGGGRARLLRFLAPPGTAGGARLIEFELSLAPDAAAQFSRLRRIAASKAGRARNTPVRIVWHDTPAAEMLERGLAVAEQRGKWRLEQVGANGVARPPGLPDPILAEAASPVELEPALPPSLMPVAAFEGRLLSLDLSRDGAALSAHLLDGVMRGVAAERRAARLRLAGDTTETFKLALELADDLRAAIPAAALAGEAIAAARAERPPARRLGAPALSPDLTVASGFAHVVAHLADVMLHWGGLIDAEEDALEPVHQMRVAMRRLRSALAQFRPALQSPLLEEANAGLKALGGVLGPARDWDVFCSETGRAVADAFGPTPQVTRLLAAADRRRADHYRALRAFLRDAAYRKLMIRLSGLAQLLGADVAAAAPEDRAALDQKLPEFAAGVLDKRLKRLLAAGEDIETLPVPALHDLRLLCKRLRYNAEFFAPLWPRGGTRRFVRRLTALQESLGVLNDGAVAAGLMGELAAPGPDRAFAIGIVRGFVAGRSAGHEKEIGRAWTKLRRATPFWR